MSQPKQPEIGEKPFCPKHPECFIDWTCSAGLCPFRVLCKQCLTEHNNYYPHHQNQVSPLNDWYKQYEKLAKNFDPRESSQTAYHVDEVGIILKKEKYELEKISKVIDDSFEGALSILFNRLKELKEFLLDYLWRDFKKVQENYNSLVKKFSNLQKFNPKDQIFSTMKLDLKRHFREGNLKEYFDKVYSGHYDKETFNTKLNTGDMISTLKEKRKMLEEGFNVFDAEEFESKWIQELDKFVNNIQSSCDDSIFKRTKLDFLNPKSPKLVPSNKNPSSAKVTCLSTLENGSFVSKVDDGLYMTISDRRELNLLDSNQSFRVLKKYNLGEEIITSIEFLHLDPPKDCTIVPPPNNFLLLLGGDDDYPSLEIWDCLRNNRLACLENVHEYKISCLNILKKERNDHKESFFVASGSSDDYIKLWQIDVIKATQSSDPREYKIQINLLLRKKAHDSFIASITSIPACKKFPTGVLISCSQDKSIYFWEWERELNAMNNRESNNSIGGRDNGFRSLVDCDDDDEESYGKKFSHAHTDRIHGLILIHEKDDYSDLEYYATGGGEGMMKIWRASDGGMVKTFANSDHSSIYSMAYLKRDRIACTANQVYLKHFYALIWNWKTATLLLSIRDHSARVCKIVPIADNVFATCDKNKVVKLWQLESDHKSLNEKDELKTMDLNCLKNGAGLLDH